MISSSILFGLTFHIPSKIFSHVRVESKFKIRMVRINPTLQGGRDVNLYHQIDAKDWIRFLPLTGSKFVAGLALRSGRWVFLRIDAKRAILEI